MGWQLIETPRLSGLANMEFDLQLFRDFEKGLVLPTLRIYSWQPSCLSLGFTQKIEAEINLELAASLGWDVVKRPTGGGIVFHNEAEVTYSLVMDKDDPQLPKGLVPSYKKISEALVIALNNCGVKTEIHNSSLGIRHSALCFSYPAEYEVVVKGSSTSLGASRKIVGSAQKRGRKALLQQGSIFVRPTPQSIFRVLKKEHEPIEAISLEELLGRTVGYEELSTAIVNGFQKVFGITFGDIR